jgi:hypothetical protein
MRETNNMKDTLRISRTLAILTATFLTAQLASANTALWIGNPGVTATTNWSDNLNWSNIGAGDAGYTNNDLLFGNTGAIGTDSTGQQRAGHVRPRPFQ